MKNPNKDTRINTLRQAIVGLQKQYPPTAILVLNGVSHAPADIAKVFQTSIDAADATTAATGEFHQAVALERAANATAEAMYRSLEAYVVNQHGSSPGALADFGITLPSRQVPSADTVAGAAKKRAATRAARHTMGPRQKAGIKGTVPAAPEAPAPAAGSAPAPAGPTPQK
jgi:hypothetical protein